MGITLEDMSDVQKKEGSLHVLQCGKGLGRIGQGSRGNVQVISCCYSMEKG
jgi:hypothetical protein